MADPAPRPAPTLWGALSHGDLDESLLRADQFVAGIGLALAAYAALFLSTPLGLTLGALALVALGWFTLARRLRARDDLQETLGWVVPLSEIGIPSIALWLTGYSQGPAYALGSWVPPQLFTLYIALQVMRLRPALPLAAGAIAAVVYAAYYVLAVPGSVVAEGLLYQPVVQVTRTLALLATGAAGTGAVLWLRRAVTRAGAEVRAHELFGKYRLGPTIAMGGMGRVVEALYCPEGGFERTVAVKLIHPHLAEDPGFLQEFRHEASLAARLNHPHIVSALDFGTVDGQAFFAMEYVDGPTLHDLCAQRRATGQPLPAPVALHIARAIAEALHYAHAQARDEHGEPLRVVHRDLSPSNVLLARSGQVKISDFGVARALGTEGAVHTATLAGKPSYLSPEQLDHGRVDPRSDLFALGVVLWETIANRRLFKRGTELATMQAVLEEEPPPLSEHRPELGAAWGAFFERALHKDPSERFPSAAAFLEGLDPLTADAGDARPEDVAAVVQAYLDVPVLELDEPVPTPSEPARSG